MDTVPAFARILFANLSDKWTRAAVLTAINHREKEFLNAVLDPESVHAARFSVTPTAAGFPGLMSDLGHILGASLTAPELVPVLQRITTPRYPADRLRRRPGVAHPDRRA